MGEMSLFCQLVVPQVIDLVGGYQDVGSQMMILSSYQNDVETLELLAADISSCHARERLCQFFLARCLEK